MKLIKNKIFHVVVLTVFTLFYSLLLYVTSGHIEFDRILYKGKSLKGVLSVWKNFLQAGNQKYIAYAFIILTVIIIGVLLIKNKRDFNEYQCSYIAKSMIIMGASTFIVIPCFVIYFLSIPNGAVEAFFLIGVTHWSVVLLNELYLAFIASKQ